VQRSWLYQTDPGVNAVNNGQAGKNQLNMFDNANSLCLGEGIHATKVFDDSNGAFRHMRSDITAQQKNIVLKRGC